MSATQTFEQLARYDRHAHALEYGHQGHTREMLLRSQATAHQQPVNDWLAARLKHDWPLAAVAEWPSIMADQWHGWQAYYRGEYDVAADYFTSAWYSVDAGVNDLGFRRDVILGLGKVYTRTGHWQAARGWLILYLAESRQQVELFSVTQGYGALGELLLRAGHAQEALACLNTAFHILPQGSGQQSRQLNYLASALIRNNEWQRAESLLKTSIQNSRDMLGRDGAAQEARSSIYHALARLQFLELERHGADARDVVEVWCQSLKLNLNLHEGAADQQGFLAVAQGFLAVGRALRFAALGLDAAAHEQLIYAERCFGQQYPMESTWAAQLAHLLANVAPQCCPEVRRLIALDALQAPESPGVLDVCWQQPELSSDNGFTGLLNSHVTFAALSAQWRIFFL